MNAQNELDEAVEQLRRWEGLRVVASLSSTRMAGAGTGLQNVRIASIGADEDGGPITAAYVSLVDEAANLIADVVLDRELLDAPPEVSQWDITARLDGFVVSIRPLRDQEEDLPVVPSRYTERQLSARRLQRKQAAASIDPATAHGIWTHEQVLDPYGDFNLRPEEEQVGRCYWLFDPDDRIWIEESDVRALHPDISDGDWRDLVRAAFRRQVEANPPSPKRRAFIESINDALGLGPEGYP